MTSGILEVDVPYVKKYTSEDLEASLKGCGEFGERIINYFNDKKMQSTESSMWLNGENTDPDPENRGIRARFLDNFTEEESIFVDTESMEVGYQLKSKEIDCAYPILKIYLGKLSNLKQDENPRKREELAKWSVLFDRDRNIIIKEYGEDFKQSEISDMCDLWGRIKDISENIYPDGARQDKKIIYRSKLE